MASKQSMVNIRLEGDLKERLERQADKEHRTLTGLIKHILLNYLESSEVKRRRK